ncbi:hypothetical protein ATCCBAA256_06000 [Mycobacterium montefiorense]|nr:hypothetical protein NJB18182_26550 [Mycobacterium montefiorense]GLE51013.1 hypothetical protein ATCCBAA256_06000 [Mycobacterium montefiorense]
MIAEPMVNHVPIPLLSVTVSSITALALPTARPTAVAWASDSACSCFGFGSANVANRVALAEAAA